MSLEPPRVLRILAYLQSDRVKQQVSQAAIAAAFTSKPGDSMVRHWSQTEKETAPY